MGSTRKILMIEDSDLDAELTEIHIRRAGLQCVVERVDSREALQNALTKSRPDAIVCDFSLPTFSGIQALDLSRELAPDTPFIFFSGSIRGPQVETAQAKGATAILEKGRYKDLIEILTKKMNG